MSYLLIYSHSVDLKWRAIVNMVQVGLVAKTTAAMPISSMTNRDKKHYISHLKAKHIVISIIIACDTRDLGLDFIPKYLIWIST